MTFSASITAPEIMPQGPGTGRSGGDVPAGSSLFHAEDRLFAAWLERRPTLLRDGALGGSDSTYTRQPVRVLFALKEPNDSGQRWTRSGADLRLQTDAFAELRSTFPVILLLTLLAQHLQVDRTLELSFTKARERLRDRGARLRLLRSIALVNLKKTPGGPVCDDRALAAAVADDGDLLLRQLSLYQPHLTIAGGAAVHSLLARLTGHAVEMPRPFNGHPGRPFFRDAALGLCLSFFHPQATKGYQHLFDLLRTSLLAHPLLPGRPPTSPASTIG